MNTYTFQADEKTIKQIYQENKEYLKDNNNPYLLYFFKRNDVSISIYSSKKVVIQGENSQYYYQKYQNKQKIQPHGGSDEVGTGDFFGPICVCATIIDEESIKLLSKFNITDSKAITDSYILNVVPQIIDKIPHSLIILDNVKYNQQIKLHNLNEIKALLHNQCYLNLIKKGYKLPENIIIDDFCGKDNYYYYLRNQKEVVDNISFFTKAESKYLAVGCGSMIARYAFLMSMQDLSEHYQMTFPKGASDLTIEFGKEFINKYSISELNKVCKMNFKNYQKIIEQI